MTSKTRSKLFFLIYGVGIFFIVVAALQAATVMTAAASAVYAGTNVSYLIVPSVIAFLLVFIVSYVCVVCLYFYFILDRETIA